MAVAAVKNEVSPSEAIGKAMGGLLCLDAGKMFFRPKEQFISSLKDVTRDKLQKAGYAVKSGLFAEEERKADIAVAARITAVAGNCCYSVLGAKGEWYMEVTWTLYDNKADTIVLTVKTEGTGVANAFDPGMDNTIVSSAFAVAADNLVGNEAFHRIVNTAAAVSTSGKETASGTPSGGPVPR